MADSAPSHSSMTVDIPEPGKVAEYTLSPDVPVKFGFYVSEVLFSCDGKDLVLTGEHGGVVIFKDYLSMAQDGALPNFELHGGEEVPGNIYLFAFTDSALDVETAAGPLTDQSESVEEHIDSKGSLIHDDGAQSALDSVHVYGSHGDHILTYNELFGDSHSDVLPHHIDEVGYVPGLFGADHVSSTADLSVCSLADNFDPLGDILQHTVDFHHSF